MHGVDAATQLAAIPCAIRVYCEPVLPLLMMRIQDYLGPATELRIAEHISMCHGPSGSNAEYAAAPFLQCIIVTFGQVRAQTVRRSGKTRGCGRACRCNRSASHLHGAQFGVATAHELLHSCPPPRRVGGFRRRLGLNDSQINVPMQTEKVFYRIRCV